MKVVGRKTIRVDGPALVRGKPVFTSDLDLKDVLHCKLLHSPLAHAEITHIDTSAARALPGVAAVLTHLDFDPVYFTSAGQGYPEPSPRDMLILDSTVRYVGDRVALVAAETPETATAALARIGVEYQPLPAVFDPRLARDHLVNLHPLTGPTGIWDARHNVAAHFEVEIGDVTTAFKGSRYVYEGTYSTPFVQQAALEPHVTLTWLDPDDRLVIRTSTQVPFHVRRIVSEVLGIPLQRIRVIKPRIGGGFGGKQEILNEELCAAVTLKTGRPARLEYTRREEFFAARCRHPQIIQLKIGLDDEHRIQAIAMNILENTGAYGAHALTVMSVTAQKTLSLYRAENIRVVANAVYTNLPVAGAYRGYGAPQGFFALEVLMDEIATDLGLDPVELRRRNLVRVGDELSIAQVLGEGGAGYRATVKSMGLEECLSKGQRLMAWKRRRKAHGRGPVRRGVGVAAAGQGSGIPGVDMASAFLKMNEDGSFNLLVGATDLGTGSDTVLAQIAAEVLEVPVARILVYSSDTDLTPFDTGAYASSTTYLSGGAVKKAAEKVREQLLATGLRLLQSATGKIRNGTVIADNGRRLTYAELGTRCMYTEEQCQIMASASHVSYDSPAPYNATFVAVSVDTETGLVSVDKVVSVTDAGQVINPQMAAGQAEGAIPQALGMALSEFMLFDDQGRPLHTDFHTYHIYTAIDMPEIVTRFVTTHEPTGPFGAKAAAEIPINGPAPAVVNAIYNACGVRIRELPVTPEKILQGLKII